MNIDGGWSNYEEWATVSTEDVQDEQGSFASSSTELINESEPSHLMFRRGSVDSVEVMSMENDADVVVHDTELNDNEFKLTDSISTRNSLCCSCVNAMNQSTISMVHVRLEEVETQTEDLAFRESKGTSPHEVEIDESQLEKTLDSIAEYIHRHGHQLIFIPSHILFAMIVLTGCYFTGTVHFEFLERSQSSSNDISLQLPAMTTHSTSTVDSQKSQTAQLPIRELQSPEWLERLSSLLDDVSDELVAVDAQVSNVEKQLEKFDQHLDKIPSQSSSSASKSQLFILDAYQQLVEKQRAASRLLDRLNAVLNVDRHSRNEPASLLDVRLSLIDVASDLVTLNSRMTEVALANKHRHINMVKKGASDRHRTEAAYLQSIVDRIQFVNAGLVVSSIDGKSNACKRLLHPSKNAASQHDVVECLVRSRTLASESAKVYNDTIERERSISAHYRQKALIAEKAVSDLRGEIHWLNNRTIFMKSVEQKPQTAMQCLSTSSVQLNSLLSKTTDTKEMMENVANRFALFLNEISRGVLDGKWSEKSTTSILDMLSSTFTSLSNSLEKRAPPVPKGPEIPVKIRQLTSLASSNTTWSGHLTMKLGSFKTTISKAYDSLKKSSVINSLLSSHAFGQQCRRTEEDVKRLKSRLVTLQTNSHYLDSNVLNSLFRDADSIRKAKCISSQSRFFSECQVAWAQRMMRLFRWPFCSDKLPETCSYQDWQMHLMASIEMTSTLSDYIALSNETSESSESKRHSEKKADQGPPAPRIVLSKGKKGDDGKFEGNCLAISVPVKEMIVFRRPAAAIEYCRPVVSSGKSRYFGPILPKVIELPSVFPQNEEDRAQICRPSSEMLISSKRRALIAIQPITTAMAPRMPF